MDKYIYYRMAGNGCMFILLTISNVVGIHAFETIVPKRPDLLIFYKLTYRYGTIWNVTIQTLYTLLAFICDLFTVLKMEEKISPAVRSFRHRIFHEIVFPFCIGITPFWPVYFYDRELIFPVITEVLLSKSQNVLIHGVIFVYVAWEMAHLPHDNVKKSDVKVTKLALLLSAYFLAALYTKYISPGVWVYEILSHLEGSILFFLMFYLPFAMSATSFYLQWTVRDFIWKMRGPRECKSD